MPSNAPALPLVQTCWVVPDIAAAASGWLAAGVGPFLTFRQDFRNCRYRGATVRLTIDVALAQAGAMQIELIRQVSDGPSAFRDVVPAGASGLHHLCREFGGYDETVARLTRQGIVLATEIDFGGTRFCYADARAQIGCMLEVVDDTPLGRDLVAAVRDAARAWDGTDPIRPHPMFS